MKTKLNWWFVIGTVLLFVAGWCGSNVYHTVKNRTIVEHNELLTAQIGALEAARAQERDQYETEIAILRSMVMSAGTIISDLEETITARDDQIEEQDIEIASLRTAEVQELIERYPALKTFTLAFENQVGTLKAQVFDLKATIVQKDIQIAGLNGIIELKDKEIASVTKDFEDEKTLRIQTQKDFAEYRQKPGPTSIWTKLLWTGVGYGVAKAGNALKLF